MKATTKEYFLNARLAAFSGWGESGMMILFQEDVSELPHDHLSDGSLGQLNCSMRVCCALYRQRSNNAFKPESQAVRTGLSALGIQKIDPPTPLVAP